jgi:DNA processing protein
MLVAEIKHPDVIRKAEKELAFIEKKKIDCYFLTDENYPFRLRECADDPLLVYFKGKADLDAKRIVSVVGTRRLTDYGKTLTDKFICSLAQTFPDAVIISGLAYGIDICAHRSALKYQLPTVAVLAHGLDHIYPSVHRQTAIDMLEQGGLVTDFPGKTNMDKSNFVRRNRIIAGLSDATIVVESADKGGSLITAEMAFSYGRDVFAFPGRTTDAYSQGCNRIIRQNKAGLITSADDFISAMCWDVSPPAAPQIQTELFFPDNSSDGRIMAVLSEKNEIHVNLLAIEVNMPVYQLSDMLLDLEMRGLIKTMPGNIIKRVT